MSIYEKVKEDKNIYLAIYSLQNSIQNREMIFEEDLDIYRDIYHEELMSDLCRKVKNRMERILNDEEEYLKCKVYFKPKKIDEKSGKVQFRPIHQYESLEECAVAIAMLNAIIYDFKNICENCDKVDCEHNFFENGNVEKKMNCSKLQFSDIVNLIPGNFYGNRVDLSPERVYMSWQKQYGEYTSKASEMFLRYHTTKEYSYEVDIDIVDFFPSINPKYIISFIMEKLPVYIDSEDRIYIEKILTKLLYVEVVNLPTSKKEKLVWESYYKRYLDKEKLFERKRWFSVGLPQGLVQAYFFANIFMILVDQEYSAEFKGEMLYYVDDSVIFTNELDDEFEKQIERIERRINSCVLEKTKNYNGLNGSHKGFAEKMEYIIEMHKNDDKSSYTYISDSRTGEIYLTNICRTASQAAVEINNSLSDNEDVTLRARVKKMREEIEKEIDYISRDERFENDLTIRSYKKKLQRYYKFFRYREMLLQYREELNFKNIFEPLIKSFLENDNDNQIIEKFFKNYNEDIFLTAISFALKVSKKATDKREEKTGEKTEQIKNYVELIDRELFGFKNANSSYLGLVMKKIEKGEKIKNRFTNLEKIVESKFPDYRGAHDSVRKRAVEDILGEKLDETLKTFFSEKFFDKILYIYVNSSEIRRDLLNCIVSNIFNMVVEDSYNFSKKENRMLTYKEVRLLAYIRNYRFKMADFKKKKAEFLSEGMESIDYSLLEVLKCFRLFVKEPDRIDDLIKIHQYTCAVWKNGSKHLYFYTLHNQEHAVLLIKNCVELVKSIHFIKLSKMDYYILFIACYLHDISMVTIPNLQMFNEDNVEANEIATKYLLDKERFSNESKAIKNLLIRYYKQLDEYYEKQVRRQHARKSGQEIRKRKDLEFIETFAREVIAQVSEAHGYGVDEVYKAKSVASEMIYSRKFMQIILRLADLLDISAYRISKPLLNSNIENMSLTSSFHWISHKVTEDYQIKVSYYDDGTSEEDLREETLDEGEMFKSYLKPKRITEQIDIEIYMNFRQFTEEESLGCKKMRMKSDNVDNCKIRLICGEECNASKCNFMCKWVAIKNSYLFEELCELKRYLNDNKKNFFKAELNVTIITRNNMKLTSKEFDIINKEINRKC